MTPWRRFLRFNAVSAVGIGVQLAVLTALVRMRMPYLAATVAGVSAAVVHNFWWHWRWTWRDRASAGAARTFAAFVLANGAVSLATNVIVMAALVTGAGSPPVVANLIAIAAAGLVNFAVGDRVVFRDRAAYSVLNATSGSTRDARHAGNAPASRPMTARPMVAATSAAGSCGERP
jgi:putative flippase GtrA